MKRLSPDEYILGALSLYLVSNCLSFIAFILVANIVYPNPWQDFINLFLYILRVVREFVKENSCLY